MAPVARRGLTLSFAAMIASAPWIGWAALLPLLGSFITFIVFKLPAVHRRLGVSALVGTWVCGELGMVGTVLMSRGHAEMMVSMMMVPTILASIVYPKRYVLYTTVAAGILMPLVGWLADPAHFADHPAGFVVATAIAMAVPLMALATRDAESASRRESRVDTLTGVGNRHGLAIERQRLQNLSDEGEPLALLLGDIDAFKAINDTHGHAVGDAVLAAVAEIISGVTGTAGPVFRFGGEEFLVVLVGDSAGRAGQLADDIRQAVSAQPLCGVSTTISVGVAWARHGTRQFDEVFERADSCLYAAKGIGGDQVRQAADVTVASTRPTVATALPSEARPTDTCDVRLVLDRQHLAILTEHQLARNLWAYGLIVMSVLACLPVLGWPLLIPALSGAVVLRVAQSRVRTWRRPETTLLLAWIVSQMLNMTALIMSREPPLWALAIAAPSIVGSYAAFPRRQAHIALASAAAILVAGGFAIDAAGVLAEPYVLVIALSVVGTAATVGRGVGDMAARLRSDASHDLLTGLPNRYACFDAITQSLMRVRATGGSVAVIVTDLDHFKLVNDVHGHSVGDDVLAAVAERIRSHIRPDVAFFRMGGEEFALLAPVRRARDAFDLAERLRLEVRREPLAGIDMTMSFGVALAGPDDQRDPTEVFTRADDALYLAKRAGRDRVRLGVGSGVGASRAVEVVDAPTV